MEVLAGRLVPVMGLAERAGLAALVREHVTITARTAVNAAVKVGCGSRGGPGPRSQWTAASNAAEPFGYSFRRPGERDSAAPALPGGTAPEAETDGRRPQRVHAASLPG